MTDQFTPMRVELRLNEWGRAAIAPSRGRRARGAAKPLGNRSRLRA